MRSSVLYNRFEHGPTVRHSLQMQQFWLVQLAGMVAQFLRGGNASFLSYIISTPILIRFGPAHLVRNLASFRTPHHGPHFGIGTVSCVVAAALCLASSGYPTPTIAYILRLLAAYVSLVRMHLLGSGNAAHDVPLFCFPSDASSLAGSPVGIRHLRSYSVR